MSYPNRTINDGPYGSFMADPANAAIGIYVRCKFATPSTPTPDGKPTLVVAAINERADVITMQPIAAGAYGTVKFANGGGEQFGIMSGGCAVGVELYTAADGKVSTTSSGGALLAGKSTSAGYDGKAVTYANNIPAA